MNAQTGDPRSGNVSSPERGRGLLVGGAVMLFSGLLLLLGQVVSLGAWFLVILGLGFTAAGAASHGPHWFIPGGVLSGIGLGALLVEARLVAGETAEGGVFLLAFALGWASIYLLTRVFTARPLAWALIPATVLALIGGALLLGEAGLALLQAFGWLMGYAWPLALIAGGAALIARGRRR
jgi:hypothetical protein